MELKKQKQRQKKLLRSKGTALVERMVGKEINHE